MYGTEWPILCWFAIKKLLTHWLKFLVHLLVTYNLLAVMVFQSVYGLYVFLAYVYLYLEIFAAFLVIERW